MKRFVMFAVCMILGVSMAACAVAGASGEYPSTKIRYKMTVEVETPEGIKTGSAVREISMVSRPEMLAEGNDTHVRLEKGEAVVVDLGGRGTLFALLNGSAGGVDHAIWAMFRAFPPPCDEGPVSICGIRYYSSLKNTSAVTLQLANYPMLVMFGDINDPKTVTRVLDVQACPSSKTHIPMSSYCLSADHFATLFGEGVKLKSVTVEIAEDNPEGLVEKWLPWLREYEEKMLDGKKFNTIKSAYPLANSLGTGSFRAGRAGLCGHLFGKAA